ncbi:MAG TPA: nitronate monooxygenase [Candidatus Margulisiibacteriota bacterium]|nr:nitronate monooxygenase [Candidatus Margulisiibacteriota bacterium]
MLHTPLCDLLGIEYPIVLAGMGGVSMHKLVAAVSNAGGLGVIGGATLDAAGLRQEIHQTRALTDKPFAVDLLAPIPDMIRPQMQVVFDEGIKIFVAGLAVPREFIVEMHARGMIVIVMIGKVRHAIKSEQAGADVVAAQGTEAGGHTGEIGGLALVPQVVDAVKIPVLAAGGIADGRGLVAALALGAQGIVVGTRFVATPEAQAAPQYRQAILGSGDADTIRTRCYTGKPARTIRNRYNEGWERKTDQIQPFPMQVGVSVQEGVMDYMGIGRGADPDRSFMPAGQGMGLIRQIKPAGEVLGDIVREAEAVLAAPPFARNGR